MDECVAQPKEKPMEIEVLIGQVREALGALPDARKGGNNQRYSMEDAALSAFGVFFTQSPSFLDYAQRMQKERGSNNASTLFGVHEIPSMQQVRNVLDGVEAKHLDGLFMDIAESMHKQGQLQTHRMFNGGIAIALDGTQYFCSTAIGCAHCSKKKLADGQECNFHVVVTPVVVAAGQQDVFALAPSYVMPQDGNEKQDCELAASGRSAIPNLTLPCSRGCFALGCSRFECFEHEVEQLLPAFKQNVLQQGTQVLKESAARR